MPPFIVTGGVLARAFGSLLWGVKCSLYFVFQMMSLVSFGSFDTRMFIVTGSMLALVQQASSWGFPTLMGRSGGWGFGASTGPASFLSFSFMWV